MCTLIDPKINVEIGGSLIGNDKEAEKQGIVGVLLSV